MKVIALGNDNAGDDGAALIAANRVASNNPVPAIAPDIVFAGRAGTELLNLLDSNEPVILLDVVTGTGPAGHITRLTFDELVDGAVPGNQVSSHGFGPTEVLKLGQALGRSLPAGCFIGIEGKHFEPGSALSAPVSAAMEAFVDTIRSAITDLSH